MSNKIFLDSAVVSHSGTVYETNTDNFYINGRFKHDYENSNVEVTQKDNGESFIFGICDGIREENGDDNRSFEMIKALKIYDQQFKNPGGDINSKIKLLEKSIEETNNVIYSKNIKEKKKNENKIGFAFSGMIMFQNKMAAINIGNCGVYLLRDEMLKQLTNEHKRVNKLIKMGIISDDQAKKLVGKKLNLPIGNDRVESRISESTKILRDDIYLLCSDGLSKSVDEEKIKSILNSKHDSSTIANNLIKEARKNLVDDNITIMIIKVTDLKTKVLNDRNNEFNEKWGKVRNRSDLQQKDDKKSLKIVRRTIFIIFICATISLMYISMKNNNQKLKESKNNSSLDINTSINDNSNEVLEYKVEQGDTIESISRDYYADESKYKLIMLMNKIERKDDLKIGKTIYLYPEEIIPEDVKSKYVNEEKNEYNSDKYEIYTVKSGDTLGSISFQYFNTIVKADMIKSFNNINDENELKIGMEIKIPKEN